MFVQDNIPYSPTIRYAVNKSGRDKDWNFKELTEKFKDTTGSLDDVIADIKAGYAICAGTLNNRYRNKANVTGSNWILVDIDNSTLRDGTKVYDQQLTLEQALEREFVKKYCSLIYTTASHTPEWHKFRVLFLLPEFVEDVTVLEETIKFLLEQFPHDPACKDACRVFYGSTKAEFPLVNYEAVLPKDWIKQATHAAEIRKQETEQKLKEWEENQHRWQEYSKEQDLDIDEQVYIALGCIPQRCPGSGNYNECFRILAALKNHYGDVQAEIIAEKWSPSITGNDWQIGKKLRGMKKEGITIGTLFHIAKQYGFRFPKQEGSTGKRVGSKNLRLVKGGGSSGGDGNLPETSKLKEYLDKLIDKNLTGSDLDIEILELADLFDKNYNYLRNTYNNRLKERSRKDDTPETKEDVLTAIELDNYSLNLEEILPVALAEPIIERAKHMNLKPECYLHQLLATSASLLKSETKLRLLNITDFEVTGNLFSGIIAEASQRKSPIRKAVTSAPLKIINQKIKESHKQKYREYQQNHALWKSLKGEERYNKFPDGEPVPPVRRILYFTNTTIEGLKNQIANTPNHGILWNTDELASFYKSQNAYRNGKGSDEEDILSFYDGDAPVTLRASGLQHDLDNFSLSICGTIQPDVIDKFIGSGDDPNGKLSRFNWVIQPLSALYIESDDAKLPVFTGMLAYLYNNIDLISANTYKLSAEAKKPFINFYNEVEQLRIKDPHQGMRAVWGKAPGKVGKLALNLHVIEHCFLGIDPPLEVELETIQAAIKLQKYYIAQTKALYSKFTTDSLTPHLKKMLEFAKAKDGEWVLLGDYRKEKFSTKNRPDASTLLGYLTQLEQMNLAQVVKEGKSIKFKSILENSGTFPPNSGTKVEPSSTIQTSTSKGLQENSGNSGTFSQFYNGTEQKNERSDEQENQDNDSNSSKVPPGDSSNNLSKKSSTISTFPPKPLQDNDLDGGTEFHNSSTIQKKVPLFDSEPENATTSNTYIDRDCLVKGGDYDGQQVRVTEYDSQDDMYGAVSSKGEKLWFLLKSLELLE